MRKKRKKLHLKSYSNIKYTISKERNKEREAAVTMAEAAAAGWSHFDSFGGKERVIFGTDNLLPGIFPCQIRN